ncbi:MAG TPA: hypothetical protein VEF04_02170, partial [Blastocatellia bacterium]|nr:hypothetical protein [Blastocatellia bacterium]
MWTIILIILLCLGVGLFGFLCGWLLNRVTHSVHSVELVGQLRDEMRDNEEALYRTRKELLAEQTRALALEEERDGLIAALSEREEQLKAIETQLDQVNQENAATTSQLDA